jgi:hypothetical protein
MSYNEVYLLFSFPQGFELWVYKDRKVEVRWFGRVIATSYLRDSDIPKLSEIAYKYSI